MSSNEIRKKIEELETGLKDFTSQVDTSILKYNDALNEIKNIELMIEKSNDTLVIKSISNTNGKILNNTNKLIEKMETEKNNVITKINMKINDLIEQEKLALIEEAKIRDRQRKAKDANKNNNLSNNNG